MTTMADGDEISPYSASGYCTSVKHTPPEWKDAPVCHACTTMFNQIDRKHHCRNCGNIFCDKHSSRRLAIPEMGFDKPVRVCMKCWDLVLGNVDPLTEKRPETQTTFVPENKFLKTFMKEPAGHFTKGGLVTGTVIKGWESVRDAFEDNFRRGFERAAQLAIYHKGKLVVDLSGHNKSVDRLSYNRDTIQCIYSSGKNVEVLVVAMLVDRGLIAYDDLVTKHWPEFGQNGKESVTIADVMRHEAGIATFVSGDNPHDRELDSPLTWEELESFDRLDKRLEGAHSYYFQTLKGPTPDGRKTKRNYHALTRGLIIGGILRRVDPNGRSFGQFVKEELTNKLNVKMHCGISESDQAKLNIADLREPNMTANLTKEILPAAMGIGDKALVAMVKVIKNKNELIRREALECYADLGPGPSNSVRGRAIELSSGHMLGNARAIAKLNVVLSEGSFDGVDILSDKALKLALSSFSQAYDAALHAVLSFSQGGICDLSCMDGAAIDTRAPNLLRGYVGWGGWGGSLSLLNKEKKISVGYTITGMNNLVWGGHRFIGLATAIKSVVDNLSDEVDLNDDGVFSDPSSGTSAGLSVPGSNEEDENDAF